MDIDTLSEALQAQNDIPEETIVVLFFEDEHDRWYANAQGKLYHVDDDSLAKYVLDRPDTNEESWKDELVDGFRVYMQVSHGELIPAKESPELRGAAGYVPQLGGQVDL